MEQIFVPSQVVTLVKSARTETPFDVIFVNVPLTDDLSPDENPIVTVRVYKSAIEPLFKGRSFGGLDLNSIRELRFVGGSTPLANFSERFTNPPREISIFSDCFGDGALDERIANALPMYEDFLPIKLAKVKNLEILVFHTILAQQVWLNRL
ncbi:unnamed protein product [Allacma fusca]|uniref:Uncharacterized protein n=1 Tax=Allacma fusca TaxID=39272 RepID=A0A8J2P1W8_9HEXA|nr:unnamed protein product [Allacma fusca]